MSGLTLTNLVPCNKLRQIFMINLNLNCKIRVNEYE